MEVVLTFLLLIALGIASRRWRFESPDKIESPEWVRRAAWDASHRKSDVQTDE
jgi:hypothetical protein